MIDAGRRAATAIRDARVLAGLTQEKAAALREHATSTVSRWESGGLPQTWEELHQYAKALGQPIVLEFGPGTKKPAAEPRWVRRLEKKLDEIHARQDTIMARQAEVAKEATASLTKTLAPLARLEDVDWIADAIRRARPQGGGVLPDSDASGAPGTGAPEGQESS